MSTEHTGVEVMGHTKEPWVTVWEGGEDAGHWIYNTAKGSDEYAIAVTFSLNPKAEQDARRIVACVNACAGISTEYLENDKNIVCIDADGIKHAELEERVAELEELRERVLSVKTEVDCRVSHGADSNGHLEFILTKLDKALEYTK